MKLQEIHWPVYKLGNVQTKTRNGVLYIEDYYYNKDNGTFNVKYKIVDDTNIPGGTIGLRRLRIPEKERSKLDTGIYLISDLLKLAKPNVKFIDSVGNVFTYKKSTRAKLVCKEVEKIIPCDPTGAYVQIKGLSSRFRLLYKPEATYLYAGLLVLNHSYILYGMYQEPFKDTYRKI